MDELLTFLCGVVLIIFVGAFIFLGLYAGGNGVFYLLDKSICSVEVDNKQVYNDKCHFVNISSIGENGNTKHLTIYKDIFCLKAKKHYISENIVIK